MYHHKKLHLLIYSETFRGIFRVALVITLCLIKVTVRTINPPTSSTIRSVAAIAANKMRFHIYI